MLNDASLKCAQKRPKTPSFPFIREPSFWSPCLMCTELAREETCT